jgi:ribonuclease HII
MKTKANTKTHFEFENQIQGTVIGIDEAGCGPWAGPVVAAAVYIDQNLANPQMLDALQDSKQLKTPKRRELFQKAKNDPGIIYGIGLSSREEIDAFGLGAALRDAIHRAVENLNLHHIDLCLMDGIRSPNLPYPTQLITKGDQQSKSIAMASIMAKVFRDDIMANLHEKFPQYGWNKNAGYGTAGHIKAIDTYGLTHRQSFAPIKVFMAKQNHLGSLKTG